MKLIKGTRKSNGNGYKTTWENEIEIELSELAIEETRKFKKTGITIYYCEWNQGKLRFTYDDGFKVYEAIQTIYKTV